MTQQDLSSPAHRLDNLVNMRFVRAYAVLRYHIFDAGSDALTASDLRILCGLMEHNVAVDMDFPETALVGRLVDLGRDLVESTDGQDQPK